MGRKADVPVARKGHGVSEAIATLARVGLFAGLTPQQLEVIERTTRVVHCDRNATIIREGDEGDVMYILRKGKVAVSRTVTLILSRSSVGEGEKSFAQLDANDHPAFGEMALLEKSLRGATVTALTDCDLLEISHADFERVCRDDPLLGYIVFRNIATELSARLRRTNQDVLKLSTAVSLALSRR